MYFNVFEALLELARRQTVVVETVVPTYALEYEQVAADQPIAALLVDVALIGMAVVVEAELACASLLFAVRIDAHVAHHGHSLALVDEADAAWRRPRAAHNALAIGIRAAEHDRHRLIVELAASMQRVEVQALEIVVFVHEAAQRMRPALA